MLDLTARRILVRGGAGFLGSWLIRRLQADGCRAITVPRSRDVDLRQEEAVERL